MKIIQIVKNKSVQEQLLNNQVEKKKRKMTLLRKKVQIIIIIVIQLQLDLSKSFMKKKMMK